MRKRSNIKTKTLLRMKITALLLIASFTIVSASNTYSQTTALSIEARSQTMQTVLEQIESQSEFQFFYNTKQINTKKLVSIKAAGKNVFSVLDELFKDTNIKYEVLDKNIILTTRKGEVASASNVANATQQSGKNITGVVLDQNGDPIIGANVIEKGTTNGVVTSIDGDFTLNVPNNNAVIQVSFIGYDTQELQVGNTTNFTIRLKESSEMISEVVVTALGIKRSEKALGYSVYP